MRITGCITHGDKRRSDRYLNDELENDGQSGVVDT